MATPLPDAEHVLLTPPDRAEAEQLARAVVSTVAPADGLTELQRLLVRALFVSMTGHDVDPDAVVPMSTEQAADGMARRNLAFRTRIVQVSLLCGLVLAPMPADVAARLRTLADELEVDEDIISVAEAFATGALDLAATDFARNGYLASVDPARLRAVHAAALASSWGQVVDDPALAARWVALEELPVGTLGRGVADFYRDRGFVYPGLPGSAPPLLAQHDWVHVLAGYGTTVENELEVFAFIARANDDPRAFSLLAMVVSLFETGYLAAGAGLFQADPGHLRRSGMPRRLADAMRRGALVPGSRDFLELDWFDLADRPVPVLRQEIGVPAKGADALAAGSVGPWQPGGISPFQLAAAQRRSESLELVHHAWQPDPARD
jgi:hypothetical protein